MSFFYKPVPLKHTDFVSIKSIHAARYESRNLPVSTACCFFNKARVIISYSSMPAPTVFYKAPAVTMQRLPDAGGSAPATAPALLKTEKGIIYLDAEATEELVRYLRVRRSYNAGIGQTGKSNAETSKQLGVQLAAILFSSGAKGARYQHVTQLIQTLGCLHDWATASFKAT